MSHAASRPIFRDSRRSESNRHFHAIEGYGVLHFTTTQFWNYTTVPRKLAINGYAYGRSTGNSKRCSSKFGRARYRAGVRDVPLRAFVASIHSAPLTGLPPAATESQPFRCLAAPSAPPPHSYTFAALAVWASIAVFILVFVVQLVTMATPDMRCTGRSFSHGANHRNTHYQYY